MDGKALVKYLSRLLAEEGASPVANRVNQLFDYLTEGRDELLATLSLAAPIVVQSAPIALEQVDAIATPLLWRIPAANKDPFRVLTIREVETGEPFSPSGTLNQDGGDYEWVSLREIKLSDDTDAGEGIEIIYVPHAVDITTATTEAQVGLPTTCHRAIAKYAAVIALTADEESDPAGMMGLFERELDRIERIYGDFDAMGGGALRSIFMSSIGQQLGESTY